jgi:mono/diheme cytochrome c family protein
MTAARRHSTAWWILAIIGVVIALLILASVGSWLWFRLNPVTIVEPPPGVSALLTQTIPDGPDAAQLLRGRYMTIAGDCMSCHTRAGGHPFAGGLGLQSSFGTIYSSNITSDRATGIGNWTPAQFYRALHEGKGAHGRLYPAMPYPHFTMISRADSDAMLAFLKTVPAEHYTQPANRLPFPLDIRLAMIGWNMLNFSPHGFKGDPNRSAQWNRGAYLVNGPGHCGACHTPKTALQAEQVGKALRGAVIEEWFAPDLTSNPRTGLGRWTAADIVEYLRTGRNAHAGAVGQMAEVVTYSTSMLSDGDLNAIATYLKTLPSSPATASATPAAAAMRAGGAVFFDACTACHLVDGKGQPRMFPPLQGSAVAQQRDPTGVVRLILAGGRTAPTQTRPSFQTMPSFAWKLSDQEAADVATYVRNSWGNRASPVSAKQVAKIRSELQLRPVLGVGGRN